MQKGGQTVFPFFRPKICLPRHDAPLNPEVDKVLDLRSISITFARVLAVIGFDPLPVITPLIDPVS